MFAVVGVTAWGNGGCGGRLMKVTAPNTDQIENYSAKRLVVRERENHGREILGESLKRKGERIRLPKAD
jgi:hypothetical protein